jgi:putative membrane protein
MPRDGVAVTMPSLKGVAMAWHIGNGMGWWMLWGSFLWIAFWAFVIYAIVSLVRGSQPDKPERHNDEPIEIAKRRYASGAIDKDEFDRIRRDLAA